MRNGIVLFVLLALGPAAVIAAEISGRVTVLDKNNGTPLGSFANAVVFVAGLETPPPREPAVMDQTNKAFVPRLLPVVKGQEIRFLNSDTVQHNVFSPHEREAFDLGRYAAGERRSVKLFELKRHKIYCDIHKRMIADIYVLPNRYFSVTDDSGIYRIEGVPPGNYTLKVWHIFGGSAEQAIRVDKGPLAIDFTVRSTSVVQEIEEHPNKSGKDYGNAENEGYRF
jgi:plastocyanin